jgi:hypothetical protein
MAVLRANLAAAPSVLLNTIMLDLDRFVSDAPQQDDVTPMLLNSD